MKGKHLSGFRDKPGKLLDRAKRQAASIDPLMRRQAAETAHLDVFSAVARTVRRELRGTRDYQAQINRIAKEAPAIKKMAKTVYEDLHVKCFYRGEEKACTRKAVETGVRLARALVDSIEG